MRTLRIGWVVLAVAVVGCKSDKLGQACTNSNACGFGAFCASRICTTKCETDADCAAAPGFHCREARLVSKFLGSVEVGGTDAKLCLPPTIAENVAASVNAAMGDSMAKMRAELDRKNEEAMKKLRVPLLMPRVPAMDPAFDAAWDALSPEDRAGTDSSLVPILVEKLKPAKRKGK